MTWNDDGGDCMKRKHEMHLGHVRHLRRAFSFNGPPHHQCTGPLARFLPQPVRMLPSSPAIRFHRHQQHAVDVWGTRKHVPFGHKFSYWKWNANVCIFLSSQWYLFNPNIQLICQIPCLFTLSNGFGVIASNDPSHQRNGLMSRDSATSLSFRNAFVPHGSCIVLELKLWVYLSFGRGASVIHLWADLNLNQLNSSLLHIFSLLG